jgi:hypothetical protein
VLIATEAERLLRANWREGLTRDGVPYAYTCPSPRRYKHQWYWDSCFHAIVWSRLDPARARAELRTLLRAGRADGFVPHTAFWGASPQWRRAPLYATGAIRGSAATASMQTPLLAAGRDGSPFAARAARTEAALLERCWDQRRGLFFDLAGRAERPVRVSTWSSLAPLALGDAIPAEIRLRLAEEHLLHPRRYRARVGIPSVSMEEPAFRPGFDRFRTWRGPSWMNTAWLLLPALDRLGLSSEADRIAASLERAVARAGFREYYDPRTGAGIGARRFGWSTLLFDLHSRRRAVLHDGAHSVARS